MYPNKETTFLINALINIKENFKTFIAVSVIIITACIYMKYYQTNAIKYQTTARLIQGNDELSQTQRAIFVEGTSKYAFNEKELSENCLGVTKIYTETYAVDQLFRIIYIAEKEIDQIKCEKYVVEEFKRFQLEKLYIQNNNELNNRIIQILKKNGILIKFNKIDESFISEEKINVIVGIRKITKPKNKEIIEYISIISFGILVGILVALIKGFKPAIIKFNKEINDEVNKIKNLK
jgi:hypothetical protein